MSSTFFPNCPIIINIGQYVLKYKKEVNTVKFGQRLRNIRESHDMSREVLAQKLGITYWAISKYETGERSPDQETIAKIADIFGVSVDTLLGRISTQNKSDNAIDDITLNWPEGAKVLRRAHNELTPEQRRKMLKLIEAYINEEDDEDNEDV